MNEDIKDKNYKWYNNLDGNRFVLKIFDCGSLTSDDSNSDQDKTEIEIISRDKFHITAHNITINGKKYNFNSIQLFNKVKELIYDNFDSMISLSRRSVDDNKFTSLTSRKKIITLKYEDLIINIDGSIKDGREEFYKEFIDYIKKLVVNEGEKTEKDYIMELFNNNPDTPKKTKTPLEEEFEKYCKLYEERFGKRAYIAESSGTMQQTIDAIKMCLEKDEDILSDILYPNLKKDMEDGVLY